MKLKPAQIAAFLKAPTEAAPAALIYGPDEGLVRERSTALAKAVVPDIKDPFLVANLEPAEIREDPARLGDEAAALSMIGGKRVILVAGATDAIGGPVGTFLEEARGRKVRSRLPRHHQRRRSWAPDPPCAAPSRARRPPRPSPATPTKPGASNR